MNFETMTFSEAARVLLLGMFLVWGMSALIAAIYRAQTRRNRYVSRPVRPERDQRCTQSYFNNASRVR